MSRIFQPSLKGINGDGTVSEQIYVLDLNIGYWTTPYVTNNAGPAILRDMAQTGWSAGSFAWYLELDTCHESDRTVDVNYIHLTETGEN